MPYPFLEIIIIYNPNSTGDSKKNAKKLYGSLRQNLPASVNVELINTEYEGHAQDIASARAAGKKRILLVSSSGDGGFNEVINGVIAASNPNAAAIVLPSGNANDHHEATSQRPVEEKILHPTVELVDVIKVAGTKENNRFERYAHSYVGVGLTAYIGKKLTEATLNPINEKWLVVKYLVLFRGITLKVGPSHRWHRYSSLIFGNIGRMSKVIKLGQDSNYNDGKMEVYELRANSTLRMIISLIFGSTLGFRPSAQLKKQQFTSRRPIDVQLDGEVVRLDENKVVRVSVERNIFKTLQ